MIPQVIDIALNKVIENIDPTHGNRCIVLACWLHMRGPSSEEAPYALFRCRLHRKTHSTNVPRS